MGDILRIGKLILRMICGDYGQFSPQRRGNCILSCPLPFQGSEFRPSLAFRKTGNRLIQNPPSTFLTPYSLFKKSASF
jgi:hypothetical protein